MEWCSGGSKRGRRDRRARVERSRGWLSSEIGVSVGGVVGSAGGSVVVVVVVIVVVR